jgi:TonB family protein
LAVVAALVAPARASAADPATAAAIEPPQPVEPLRAAYPEGATEERDVTLEITVRADGSVVDARVVEGAEPFAAAALAATGAFRFEPAHRAGKPIAARIRVRIHFAPPAPPPPEPAPAPTTPAPSAPAPSPASAPLEVQVVGTRAPASSSLGKAEVRVLPGAFGDPFRAIEALPGVTPIFSGAPYFYVRGAPPGDVGYFIDGVRVPALFHLFAGPAVVPGALLQHVDLHPGGYPARYGGWAGGIVTAETRPPADELHAEGSLRLIDAGAVIEAPLPGGRGSALAGARYSYTSPILTRFVPTLRYEYWDYQGRLAVDLSPHDRVTIFAFGSHDRSEQLQGGTWWPLYVSEFHRLDLRYEGRPGERTRVEHAITLGLDRSTASNQEFATPTARSESVAARSRVVHQVSDAITVRAGAEARVERFDVGSVGFAPVDTRLFPSRLDLAVGVDADAVIGVGHGVEITPGARVDFWSSAGATAVSADVRLAMRVPLGSRVRLVNATGLAHQPPGFQLPVPGAAIGGLAGGLQRSVQASAGVEADLPLDITASATLFHDAFFNIADSMGSYGSAAQGFRAAPNGSVSVAWLNDRANGSSTGLEIYVRRKLTEKLGGFVAYTLSRSTRHSGYGSFTPQFDRTHVLQTALSWDIGKGFRAGARVAVYSGQPFPPFTPKEIVAAAGRDRLPPFFRLDARAEKRWTIGHRGWISVVLEMANVTLSKEPSGIDCDMQTPLHCDVHRLGPVSLPSLGIEGGV